MQGCYRAWAGSHQTPTPDKLASVRLEIDGIELDGRFQETGRAISAHTDRQLIVGNFQFDVRDQDQQQRIAASLSQRREIDAASDGQPVRFRVRSNSYSSVGEGPPWHHSVDVEEAENVSPNEIVLDGLTLRPYKYEERAEDGGISIQTRVVVNQAGRQELEKRLRTDDRGPGRYFDVVRTGIQDSPRLMRFGQCAWSEHGDETKYDLVLVEKSVDESRPEPIVEFYREIPNMRREIARATNLIDGLLDMLVESGTLSTEQRSTIENRAKAGMWTRHWALFKLDDIDKHH